MADEIIGRISVGDGATFTPSVSSSGELSWTNNKNLPNPATVDIPQAVIDRYQLAPIASPAFTGAPTAPTPNADDDSTKIATTAYVQAELEDYATLTDMAGYLPLTGGTMTGILYFDTGTEARIQNNASGNDTTLSLYGGQGYTNGAYLILNGKNNSSNGGDFSLTAKDDANTKILRGKPDGSLIWNGKNVLTDATVGTVVSNNISSSVSLTAGTAKTITSVSLSAGVWVLSGHVNYGAATQSKIYAITIGTSNNSLIYGADGTIDVQASTAGNIALTTSRILSLSATTTVYLCGYATASATASAGHLTAVRIK